MQPITAPINRDSRGPVVVNLQAGLILLITRQVIQVTPADRDAYLDGLKSEQQAQVFNDRTIKIVVLFQEQNHLPLKEEVDQPTADTLNRALRDLGLFDGAGAGLVVRGQVVIQGRPLPGIEINVFDRDLGADRQRLGDPDRRYTSNIQGRFEIEYSTDQFVTGDSIINGKQPVADLVFTLGRDGQPLDNFQIYRLPDDKELTTETLLNSDDLILGIEARPQEEVRIVLEDSDQLQLRGTSEFELLMQTLSPVLLTKSPADLDEEKYRDITFVVRETGVEQENLELLVNAFRLSQNEFRSDVRPEIFYGLARTRQLVNLGNLAESGLADLHDGLVQAGGLPDTAADNIIPPLESEDSLQAIVEQIHQMAIELFLTVSPAEGYASLSELLGSALPDQAQQITMLNRFANHQGQVAEYWNDLRQQPGFEESGKVEKIQFALQLGILTQNNLPLVAAIQASDRFQNIRDVARLTGGELAEFVQNANPQLPPDFPGDTPAEQLDLYSQSLTGLLQAAFPTEAVAQVVAKVSPARLNNIEPDKAALLFNRLTDPNFIPAGEEFDIRSGHVDTFIDKYAAKILAGVDGVTQTSLAEMVKRSQRLFQVSTGPKTLQILIDSNLDSASDIASIPSIAQDLQAQGVDKVEADLIKSKALSASAASLHLALQVYQEGHNPSLAALGGGLKQVPEWAELFGSLELCECDECQSVYSPAAYFVDLLQFLGKSAKGVTGWNPLDVLIGNYENPDPAKQLPGKRPDLPFIKLSCENTNTPLPYIDLVNEVLESYVAFGKLDENAAKDTGDSPALELSANPQYVDEQAYFKLQNAFYPSSLPFDRSLEVSRAYLQQLGANRSEIMNAFAESPVNKLAVATEFLGFSAKEFEIVTGQQLDGTVSTIKLTDLFGFVASEVSPLLQVGSNGAAVVLLQAKLNTGGANPPLTLNGQFDNLTQSALTAFQQQNGLDQTGMVNEVDWAVLDQVQPAASGALVTTVPDFLKRTGLSYLELIDLLKTQFINPHQRELDQLINIGVTYQEVRDLLKNNFTAATPDLQAKLDRAGLDLDELKQLVQQALKALVLYSAEANCDLDQTFLQYLDGLTLEDTDSWKIQRFIRLFRKLGWTIFELDAALVAFDFNPANGPEVVQKLAAVKQLQATSGLPLLQLLSLWANINTTGDKSLYRTLFQNRAVINPPDPDFQLNSNRDELAGTGVDLVEKKEVFQGALRVRAADLAIILENTGLASSELSLQNLSQVYRFAVLAKALHLSIVELISLKALAGAECDPFSDKNPEAALKFVQLAGQVKATGFRLLQLDFIYRHHQLAPENLTASSITLNTLLSAISAGLAKIQADNQSAPDPEGELTRAKLGLLFDDNTANDLQKLLEGKDWYLAPLDVLPAGLTFPENLKAKIRFENKNLRFEGVLAPAERADLLALSAEAAYTAAINLLFQAPRLLLQNIFGLFVDQPTVEAALLNKPSFDASGNPIYLDQANQPVIDPAQAVTTALAAKYDFILQNYLPYLRDNLGRSLIKQLVGQNLKLDDDTCRLLLEDPAVLHSTVKPAKPAMADFMLLDGWDNQTPAPAGTLAVYTRLYKIALLANNFKLNKAELEYFHSTKFAALNLNDLPVEPLDDPVNFSQWETLALYYSIREGLPAGENNLADALAAPVGERTQKLLAITGWGQPELDQAMTKMNIQESDLSNLGTLVKLQQLIDLNSRTGVAITLLYDWATLPPDNTLANDIKNLTKARYDEAAWYEVARPLNDKLRESQRTALVDYVLTLSEIRNAHVSNADKLFEFFLIDVEMSACMATSRIKQAISTVQLFVQRCLLNLEPLVSPSAIDNDRWQWMKNYRVWEANRKVFLYPENWIEPELRDDKSPFFEQLEAELLQNDLTNDVAEKALLNYLFKLDQVARLEISGMFLQLFGPGEKFQSILHVVGRTAEGASRKYFYRKLIDNRTWTPWETLEVDIHGVEGGEDTLGGGIDLLPVVWNQRLYLFWLVFTQKSEKPASSSTVDPTKPIVITTGSQFWEIRLAWSKYDQGKWTSKQLSTSVYKYDHLLDRRLFRLKASLPPAGLDLHICTFSGISVAKFSLDNYHGEAQVGGGSGYKFEPRPGPGFGANYMGYQAGPGLNFKVSSDSDVPLVPILGGAPSFNMLTLSQFYPWPLTAPAFYRDSQAIYFIRSREDSYSTLVQIAEPAKVLPNFKDKLVKWKDYDVLGDLGHPLVNPLQDKTVVSPWVGAEQTLCIEKSNQFSLKSGLGLNYTQGF